MNPVEKVDLPLLTDWVSRAEHELLLTVQEEIRRSLANILQNVRNHEAHNELYLDTIQCINAVPAQAVKFSAVLSERVQQVCFLELQAFLTQYAAEQGDFLCTQARMEQPGSKAFFQTLNNCRELRKYVQVKDGDRDVLSAAVATLESMEAFTLKLLKEIVAGMAENRLKKYFKSENREFLLLLHEVKTLFSDVSGYPGLETRVMDEVYELIAHLYLKRLVGTRVRKLRTRWHPEVGPAVTEDVVLLHEVISSMAPAVGQRNLLLLEVQDLLEQQDLEATKLTAARMQCDAASEDLELLPALLQWKGLSGAKTRKVLRGLEDLPGSKHRPASWCCGCIGC
ncbi:uncharacterized protein si:dkey-196h17.9 [Clinocottus analis]|uniref:uncharacterized protein si:dkey-196h17.9 n=1 Tax=Clinocottus analis TaxID=304258 RepID=UPI0035BF282D